MASCLLCLKIQNDKDNHIGLYSPEGIRLNIPQIISQHFWLQPSPTEDTYQIICVTCWNIVRIFHEFYLKVAEVHNIIRYGLINAKPFDMQTNGDPLPIDDALEKAIHMDNAVRLVEELGDTFYDSEDVKMEVRELNLIPQINIEINTSKQSKRSHRGEQNNVHDITGQYSTISQIKRIKEESQLSNALVNDMLDIELMQNDQVEIAKTSAGSNFLEYSVKRSREAETSKKALRRSSRKIKPEAGSSGGQLLKDSEQRTKSEDTYWRSIEVDEGDNFSDHIRDTIQFNSLSSKSESDNSLPDIEPFEEYAVIPKRIVIKPKKYRKRPKPSVPPRRMTRDEIDRRNALQIEYDKTIAQFYDKFSCAKCNILVQNFVDMKRHFRLTHNIDPGYVMCCGRKFSLRKTLAEHVHVHWNPEHFKCITCSRVFQDSHSLEKHAQEHSGVAPLSKPKRMFHCDKCPKTFTTKTACEDHCVSKHVPKSEFKFNCLTCKKIFPTDRKLKDHVKCMHDPESAIICDKCGKQVRSQSYLKRHHELEHSDIPKAKPEPVQCEICGTWLRHVAGLKQHMKSIHEETEEEHRCQICNKVSTNARALKRHIYLNHQCERKFKCTMCEKAFKRPQDLREHTSTHTGEVLYTCPNCPMTFFSNANMYKHRQRLHRAEWEAGRKKAQPPNIMQQALDATAASLRFEKKYSLNTKYN